MRRYLKWFAAGLAFYAFYVGGAPAANLPFLTPQTAGNDFLPAINQLINQLNGGPGYTGVPQITTLGPSCGPVAGTTPLTCNGQRGVVTFTSVSVAGNSESATQVINNSFVLGGPNVSSTPQPATVCIVSSMQDPGGAVGIGPVFLTTTGQISFKFINASATSVGPGNESVAFICM